MSFRVPVQKQGVGPISLAAVVLLSTLGLASLPGAAMAQDVCEGAGSKVTRLGNPATRFSSQVTTIEALQNMVGNARSEIETLLRQAGFQGDPADFFAAVASGDGISSTSVDPGSRLGWMFFRKKGAPTLKQDVCWAGKAAFAGWEVQFSSDGQWYSFVVPEACGNLALLAQQTEPVCRVSIRDTAGETCDEKSLVIDASGSTGNLSVELIDPSGASRSLTTGNSSTRRWTVDSDLTQGTFRVVATSSEPNGRCGMLECRAEDSIVRDCCIAEPPSISVEAVPDTVEAFQESMVTARPTVSACTEIDRVTLNGETVTSPYQTAVSYPEPGSYSIPATVLDGRGQSAESSATVTVTECETKDCKKKRREYRKEQRRREREEARRARDEGRDGRSASSSASGRSGGAAGAGAFAAGDWVIRAWLAKLDAEDFDMLANGNVREKFALDNGTALGLQAERLFNSRVGLGFGVLALRPEVQYELDIGPLWEMDDDTANGFSLFVGPVFHLTPNSRVDLFVSPFVAYTDPGDVSFSVLGTNESLDFDSEFSFGAQLGLDIPFGADGNWGLHAGVMYQELELESDRAGVDFAADPLSAGLGLFFRF